METVSRDYWLEVSSCNQFLLNSRFSIFFFFISKFANAKLYGIVPVGKLEMLIYVKYLEFFICITFLYNVNLKYTTNFCVSAIFLTATENAAY